MGDCYYIHAYRSHDNKLTKPKVVKIASEWVGTDNEVCRITNTTFGIWFYEADLMYREEQLKKDLMKLIKLIDNKDFE